MNNSRAKFYVLILVSVVLALAACGPAPETPTAEPVQQSTATQPASEAEPQNNGSDAAAGQAEEGYPPPAPTTAVVDGPYPPPTRVAPTPMSSYPDPEVESEPENGVAFAFDRPIRAGDTVIHGVGPAGLQISIVNVTFMAEEIATTTVGDDGRFEVTVPALEPGIRIGLTADIEGRDLAERIIPGEGEIGMPQVGYFFDSIVITAEAADS